MNKINIAFIGAGYHASMNVLPAAVEAGIHIKALSTRNVEGAKKALLRSGCDGQAYDDYMQMLEHEIVDGIVVVAQPRDQYRIALDCIRSGKNVFVEKPLGWNRKEAKTIHEEAVNNNVKVMVGFMKRFAPSYKKIKQLIDDNHLGRVRSFYLNFCVDGTQFCKDEEDFIKLAAIHVIDLVIYLFGEVSELSVFNNTQSPSVNLCVSVKTKEGVIGSLNLCNMSAWTRESENLTVTFEDGFALVEEINKVTIHRAKRAQAMSYATLTEEDTVFTPSMTPMSGGIKDLYLRGFVGELEYFTRMLGEENGPDNDGSANVLTMKLCDRILSLI